ncbi:glutaminyl-peptide cyclotransferase [Aurantiacibacter sp. D1-12]|uniref:glutaminyl-peptide cyclotransferase n=1 Tax=Aurantiacibacter sp. D1-12 TaxID=2993658 RepID=UPI00237D1F74|nr:glutaminyl-peptide cyclotransferase [Aurantiacibacter sp. D1-12]MDE1466302.1 glutaminyl-peptide cyclotransferase [Aurantiacibacter sp. D1-12]
MRAPALVVAAFAMGGCATSSAQTIEEPPEAAPVIQAELQPVAFYDVEIVAEYPHDDAAFTQGLLWHDGHLYESTGRLGTSTVRKVELESGEVLASRDIPADQFGEGLALWNDQLISLTWTHGIVHRWNLADLSLIESTGAFPFEGWGLTTLGDQLVFSDGSSTLRFLDPETMAVEREVTVTLEGDELREVNELEVVNGEIWANVWFTRLIVVIDPESGVVTKVINLADVTDRMTTVDVSDGAVLNGIAYDAENDRIFVTGKMWPSLFEIRVVPVELLDLSAPAEAQPATG